MYSKIKKKEKMQARQEVKENGVKGKVREEKIEIIMEGWRKKG